MRSVSEAIELDLSLRQSRSVFRTLAIVLLPFAAAGVFWIFDGIAGLVRIPGPGIDPYALPIAILKLLAGVIFLGAEYAALSQSREATRRLEILRNDPSRTVRRMPAPFQASLFGPYH